VTSPELLEKFFVTFVNKSLDNLLLYSV